MSPNSARISGKIPAGYTGPLFYRVSDFLQPYKVKKDLFDYLKFPKPAGPDIIRAIGLLAVPDAINSSHYRDQSGGTKQQWMKPVTAIARSSYRDDWPEFSNSSQEVSVALVSERVKEIVERYETDTHAFVAVDIQSDAGGHIARAFVMVKGKVVDFIDRGATENIPNVIIPDGNFCYLTGDLVKGRHHFWDHKLGHVWSEEIVKELGDVLPKQSVFVPVGVTATTIRSKIGRMFGL